tara:strand:+ start:314 stop:550 length:237 start_codon:yes stop_codon:yes gene_type:complete
LIKTYLTVVVGLLKLFLILTLIVYILRFIAPFIIKYLLNRLSKKMQYSDTDLSSSSRKKETKKTKNEMGEYIDYEEID